ncbi:MAG: GFA family protein, partial [Mesorhizobium sp.]
SPIAYSDERLAGHIYFTLGAMDMPAYFRPTLHAHVREQLPFLHMPDSLPRHLKTSVARPDAQSPSYGTQS